MSEFMNRVFLVQHQRYNFRKGFPIRSDEFYRFLEYSLNEKQKSFTKEFRAKFNRGFT